MKNLMKQNKKIKREFAYKFLYTSKVFFICLTIVPLFNALAKQF